MGQKLGFSKRLDLKCPFLGLKVPCAVWGPTPLRKCLATTKGCMVPPDLALSTEIYIESERCLNFN